MARRNAPRDDSDLTCDSRQHEPGQAPPLAPELSICAACRDFAEETLIELPELFDLCAFVLDPRPNDPSEWVSKVRPHSIILCDAVVEVRSEILGVLTAWSGLVIGERRVSGPDELTIRKFVGFLAVHLHWLCRHHTAPELVDELAELVATVNAALLPAVGYRAAVGTCPQPGCGRTVYAEAYREGLEPYEVACEAGHVWAPERWLSLGVAQTDADEKGIDKPPNNDGTGDQDGNGHERMDDGTAQTAE